MAESTIACYNNNDMNVTPVYKSRDTKIETKLHLDTGLQHPHDSTVDFLSCFPHGFQGCYNCGKTDHNNTRDCELACGGNFNKKQFFQQSGQTKVVNRSRSDDNNHYQNQN